MCFVCGKLGWARRLLCASWFVCLPRLASACPVWQGVSARATQALRNMTFGWLSFDPTLGRLVAGEGTVSLYVCSRVKMCVSARVLVRFFCAFFPPLTVVGRLCIATRWLAGGWLVFSCGFLAAVGLLEQHCAGVAPLAGAAGAHYYTTHKAWGETRCIIDPGAVGCSFVVQLAPVYILVAGWKPQG